jgi:L-seryl-tRNA(Ser) seleniumtransferase
MEKILTDPAAAPLIARFGREPVKRAARSAITEDALSDTLRILSRSRERLEATFAPEAPRVVNATGILIHTNLGRAPLSEAAAAAIAGAARGYHALEYDLESGRRGSRGPRLRAALAGFLGVEDALLVNNNAAAVLLVLAAAATGREVLVSRGELVAIGGSFKIPEILEASGARLREVGTTNRTRIEDYEKEFRKGVAAVLTVHPSNYEIRGYAKRPTFGEIASFAKKRRIPWIHDLGSGNLRDLSPYGVAGEERAADALGAGAALVCFSGDKLFGGPQAGVLAGRRRLVAACRSHPLARAVRVDKLALAGFFATLASWISGRPEELPIYALAAAPAEDLRRRAERLAGSVPPELSGEVISTRGLFGGGTTPERTFPSAALAVRHPEISAGELAARLRAGDPPVVGRIEGDRLILDLRGVFPEEDDVLAAALSSLAG